MNLITNTITALIKLGKWVLLGSLVGMLAGLGSAMFLAGLYWATDTREKTPWLLYLLPVAGILIGWVYDRFGRDVQAGNNLLLQRIQTTGGDVSILMAPLIVITTIATHLFGGSAGREGTAVQMGGSLADCLGRFLRLSPESRRLLLISGISGGFGAVFGTPIAGMIFGMEVLAVGRIRYDAIVPCLVASTIGDLVCRCLGIEHHIYTLQTFPAVTIGFMLWAGLAGFAFGIASRIFTALHHRVQTFTNNRVRTPWLRPMYGGFVLIALTWIVGSRDYLGLSLPLIEASFLPGEVILWAFALKILFTAITLGTGFKGGEVTPLFCIGATLGSALATLTGQSTPVFAALGFVAVFAGAANTPLACVLMGIELFGSGLAIPLAIACVASYVASGHGGIYTAQQIDTAKKPT
jgi:H+/Cl- antiporter ClcA